MYLQNLGDNVLLESCKAGLSVYDRSSVNVRSAMRELEMSSVASFCDA